MEHAEQILQAYQLAERLHRGQFRKCGIVPYIVHPLEVMRMLSRWGVVDTDILRAAMLHDVVEDCGKDRKSTRNIIKLEIYNYEKVLSLVDELTCPTDRAGRKEYYKFHKKSDDAILIKCADRICNAIDYSREVSPKKGVDYILNMCRMFNRAFGYVKYGERIKKTLGQEFPLCYVKDKVIERCNK